MICMVTCAVDEQRRHLRATLKDTHLAYVSEWRPRIAYAGVVEETGALLRRVVYFVDVEAESEAWSFIDADPYRALYSDVEVVEFAPRISRPAADKPAADRPVLA
jgi:hypothetical protein